MQGVIRGLGCNVFIDVGSHGGVGVHMVHCLHYLNYEYIDRSLSNRH